MQAHYRDTRKIDPTRGDKLGDGTPNDANRIEIDPTQSAFGEWQAAELTLPNLAAMREHRWKRLTQHVVDRDYGALLVFDPLNIRYASDTTNMQLWNTHNPFRALLLCADGYMVLWDYKNSPFLADYNPLMREVRSGADLFYFDRGDKASVAADVFSNEVRALVEAHSGTNKRLALDKIMLHGPRAGVPQGNMSEDDIWAVLHGENIRRGSEWIETRLLTSGQRTNPWFQECGPRIVQNNEIVAFDTDMIGSYGICVDISRTWWIGDAKPTNAMIYAPRARAHHEQH